MSDRRLADLASPESIASILVGLVAVVVMATQVVAKPPASDIGGPSPTPIASPSSAATMAPLVRLSLETLLAVNHRLADRAESLRRAASAKAPNARDIAAGLQAVNSEILTGKRAAEGLLSARDLAALGRDLGAHYDRIAERNGETLAATIRNVPAYVVGATAAVELLAGLSPLTLRITAALAEPSVVAARPTPRVTPSARPTTSPPVAIPPAAPTPSPSLRATVSPGPVGSGLVSNGGFEDGLTAWSLLLVDPADANVTIQPGAGVNGSAAPQVDILVGSDARPGISLAQGGLVLRSGSSYNVELDAKAAANREIRVRLTGLSGQTYVARVFPIGTSWTRISFSLTQLVGDEAAELGLDLGRWDATVWFDNVAVREQTR